MSPLRLPLSALRFAKDDWARVALNEERVDTFAALYKEGADIDPIQAVPDGEGTYRLVNGVHRTRGAVQAGCTEIDVVLLSRDADESIGDFVFRLGVETANRSTLPLTRKEQQRAVLRLLKTRPEMSHRAIARLIGISHDTVDRWASGVADSATNELGEQPPPIRTPTADEAARRLVGFLTKLDESRGVLDYLAGSRMGRHIADAFEYRLSETALTEARKFAKWTALAVQTLEERE
jgi:hypothetical protein